MSVRPMEPMILHRAYCTECQAVIEDYDVDRLGVEMLRHQAVCG